MKPTKFENIDHQKSNLGINIDIPANTQHCGNVAVRLQHRSTITLHCSEALTTEIELQRCSNVGW